MTKDYKGYLEKRMFNSSIVSWVEAELLAIVDSNQDIPECIYLIHTGTNYYTVYLCHIEHLKGNLPKIRVDGMSEDYNLNLPRISNHANHSEEIIKNAFRALYTLKPSSPIAITGKYAHCKWLLDTLSLYFKHIVKAPCNINYKPDIKNRISFTPKLERTIININLPNTTLISFLHNSQPIYIPICSATLTSKFCDNVTWGEIIGREERVGVEIDGEKCIPTYINSEIDGYNNVFISLTFILEPNLKRRILIYGTALQVLGNHIVTFRGKNPPKKDTQIAFYNKSSEKKDLKDKIRTNARFVFNGISYDIDKIYRALPLMEEKERTKLRETIRQAIVDILSVNYIVTDTNNWCTYDDTEQDLTYGHTLKRIARIIETKQMSTKFYVINEILMELKRLTRKNIGARIGQKLLAYDFMPRHLIHMPNPEEEIDYKVIADKRIQKHILNLYKQGLKISVISLDRQAMMLWQAAVDKHSNKINHYTISLFYPNFISLDNIQYLFYLWDKINQTN